MSTWWGLAVFVGLLVLAFVPLLPDCIRGVKAWGRDVRKAWKA